jgi:hypothetical protein
MSGDSPMFLVFASQVISIGFAYKTVPPECGQVRVPGILSGENLSGLRHATRLT